MKLMQIVRGSVTRWIILVVSATFVLSFLLSGAVDYFESYRSAKRQGVRHAAVCIRVVESVVKDWSFDVLEGSVESDEYLSYRRALRDLARSFHMDYIYIYSAYPERGERYHIIDASSDEEKDALVQSIVHKYTSLTPVMLAERAILSGKSNIEQTYLRNEYGDEVMSIAPLRSEGGEVMALIGVDYSIAKESMLVLDNFLSDMSIFLVSLLLGLAMLLFLVRKRILNPINLISARMREFSLSNYQESEPLSIPHNDEIGEIAVSFERMTGDIRAYVSHIEALTKDKLETDIQMDVASRIQNGLVPERTDMIGSGFGISAMTRPAKAVGGDFYDFFSLDNGDVCMMMGDVSGKGVSGAIFMALAKTIIHEKLMSGMSPADALNQANDELCRQNPEGLFVTAIAAKYNPSSGICTYSNAGHTHPLVFDAVSVSLLNVDNGIALGLFEDSGLKNRSTSVSCGQGLMVYTDGMTDATDAAGSFFGKDRLLRSVAELMRQPGQKTSGMIVSHISKDVKSFCAGSEPFDDMAVLVLFRSDDSKEQPSETGTKGCELPVELSSFDEIRRILLGCIDDKSFAKRVLLACDEILTNIVRYSNATFFEFYCEKRNGQLIVSFSDDGMMFDPTAAVPDDKDFNELDEGGMGLDLVRKTASAIAYSHRNGKNMLELKFDL